MKPQTITQLPFSRSNLVDCILPSADCPLATGLNIKYVDYDYDLVSGKVNKVGYNVGSKDQYYHQYEYDGDNRITKVFTSKDNIWWDNDAKYSYYNHGPLARTVIGDLDVQGMDYAYTLHGWLKGVNSNTLQADRDMGKDGAPGSTRQYVARDAMGYTLGYYAGDYQSTKSMGPPQNFEAGTTGSGLMLAREELFNGNISHMETAMPTVSAYNANRTITPSVRGGAYKYDQLNRLMEARSFFNVDLVNNVWQSGGSSSDYLENFTYDAMGNIQHVNRWGNGGVQMDNMDYRYNTSTATATMGNLISNRLYHVNDLSIAANYTDDIDDQGAAFNNVPIDPLVTPNVNTANNYAYDELGNLKRDNAEQIANIEWTVYGKIKKVTRTGVSTKPDLEFVYDAGGNRICKIVKPKPLSVATYKYSYYLRDAQGNEMANYELNMLNTTTVKDLTVTARPIYGSSRLGVDSRRVILWQNGTNVSADTPTVIKNRILSMKQYELSNHLGNVLVTVSDKRIAKSYGVSTVDYFEPEITTISDYYAFGSPMPTRSWSAPSPFGGAGGGYKYGFNGKEKDNEVTVEGGDYDFGARIYDSRLGRFLSLDPLKNHFTAVSPFSFAANCALTFIDECGMLPKPPANYAFFAQIAPLIFTAAKAQGASILGALLVIAQAANESGWGTANQTTKGNDFNLFGIMRNNDEQPSKRGTGDGALLDFSNLGGYAGCLDYYFNTKLKNQWPLILEIIKQVSFTTDDLNRGYYTFNYYEEPKKRRKTGHCSYHGNDKNGTAKNIDYGKRCFDAISSVKRLWVKALEYDNSVHQSNIENLNTEIAALQTEIDNLNKNLYTLSNENFLQNVIVKIQTITSKQKEIEEKKAAIKSSETKISQNKELIKEISK